MNLRACKSVSVSLLVVLAGAATVTVGRSSTWAWGGGEALVTPGCPGDVAPAGGNSVVNIDDLVAVITGWGACAPCPCSADTNSDCQVNIDDLVAVITGWGNCPCAADGLEPNDTCALARTLATATSTGGFIMQTGGRISSSSDVDVYRFQCVETDSSCSCCDGGFCLDEDFRVTVSLTVPPGGPSYRLCIHTDCAQIDTNCTTILSGGTGSRVFVFDGSCGGASDDHVMFIKILPLGPVSNCINYVLQYRYEPGCF